MNFEKYLNTLPYNKEVRKEYHTETVRLVKLFKQDFFEELGIENNPKKEILFQKAWDMGHSSGYQSVLDIGEDLVELIL